MEIFSRHVGIALLHSRLSYMAYLKEQRRSIVNPEQFDMYHSGQLNTTRCELNPDESPLVVARMKNDTYCFQRYELWHGHEFCYPNQVDGFVSNKLCEGLKGPFPGTRV
jgi:hypothetical protein